MSAKNDKPLTVNPEPFKDSDRPDVYADAYPKADGEILQVIPGKADITEKPEYDLKRLSRDFPQIFKAGGKVKKAPVFKKYTLREAMQKLENMKNSIAYTITQNEGCELSFITDVSLITIKGAAALAIRKDDDFLYEFIDAGWEFYFVGC